MIKLSVIKTAILVVSSLYAMFFIFCIWADKIGTELFFKTTLTVAVVLGLLIIFYVVGHLKSDNDLKKDGFYSD